MSLLQSNSLLTRDSDTPLSRVWPETRSGTPMPPPATGETRRKDWVLMFNAIKARLRLCVSDPSTSAAGAVLRINVLECVTAMEQLQESLLLDQGRIEQLECELADARTRLAQAQIELNGTRAGERQARHLSLHDGLTQLPNRRYFRERLEHALLHLSPSVPMLALLYLDLDGFKAINDSHGHEVGDELLRIVATRLNHLVRSEDMVSRLGGDEFACLRAGSANRPQLEQLASKLYDAVAAPLRIGTLNLSVRASIGIAIYPDDGVSAAALLKSADLAMHGAKRGQTHHAFVTPFGMPDSPPGT